MKRVEAKELLPIIRAWAEGKEIQFKTRTGKWVDIEENGGIKFCISRIRLSHQTRTKIQAI